MCAQLVCNGTILAIPTKDPNTTIFLLQESTNAGRTQLLLRRPLRRQNPTVSRRTVLQNAVPRLHARFDNLTQSDLMRNTPAPPDKLLGRVHGQLCADRVLQELAVNVLYGTPVSAPPRLWPFGSPQKLLLVNLCGPQRLDDYELYISEAMSFSDLITNEPSTWAQASHS